MTPGGAHPDATRATRPVWLTRAQREHLALYEDADGSWDVPGEIAAAWDAAPADPVEAGTKAVAEHFRAHETEDREDGLIEYREGTRAVLRALGYPEQSS